MYLMQRLQIIFGAHFQGTFCLLTQPLGPFQGIFFEIINYCCVLENKRLYDLYHQIFFNFFPTVGSWQQDSQKRMEPFQFSHC